MVLCPILVGRALGRILPLERFFSFASEETYVWENKEEQSWNLIISRICGLAVLFLLAKCPLLEADFLVKLAFIKTW